MNGPTTHIIGAGLGGLSAATTLAGKNRRVVLYEASGQAGGRCRSYYDPTFGATIDNGNHLLLSGNKAALAYLSKIGAGNPYAPNAKPEFDFIDAKTAQRWKLQLNRGIIPFWLWDKNSRVPETRARDYFSILRLCRAKREETITQLLDTKTVLYKRLWHLLLLSALNTEPEQASAQLAGAIVRNTLLKGGKACIPLVADGLAALFIDPALRYLKEHKTKVLFNSRVNAIIFENDKAAKLEFSTGEAVSLSPADSIICAVPAWNVTSLLPGIEVPDEHRAILNVHFRVSPPPDFPAILGVLNAMTEWIFAFPDRISITISNADRFMQEDREVLARDVWREIAAITGLAIAMPSWQIVKEKRATFAATARQNAKRPASHTPWRNLYLAGDYVQTGLPATMEGAIYSGAYAAEQVIKNI